MTELVLFPKTVEVTMPTQQEASTPEPNDRPWPQKLYDSIWLLAGAAFLFFVLSYVVWGLVDILTVPTG